MLNKLTFAEQRYIQIEGEMNDPDIAANPTEFTKRIKEFNSLTPVITKFREYKKNEQELQEAFEMLEDVDPDMKEMIQEEISICKEKSVTLFEELKILLLPKDPNDEKNVIIEIRAGAGGEEAALFAGVLYRMYTMYADKTSFKTSVVSCNETELGGYKEICFMVEGNGAYSRFKFESGVHRVQRVPETESQGRIQTSTVTVAVLPEAELVIETCKSSGAGGQHINKTESAIRIYHKPTGIVVWCQEERSQLKNKDKALKMLRTKLLDIKQQEQDEKISSDRKLQVGTGARSEKIRTYNYPQSRITDHRIGYTIHSLESFVNGNIDDMIDALITADTAEKLKNSTQN